MIRKEKVSSDIEHMIQRTPVERKETTATASSGGARFSIPFNAPSILGKELFYISQALMQGKLAGDGKFTTYCHDWIEQNFGAKKVLLTTSCTTALDIAALLSNIGPRDQVIMPSFTFVSTANAFALRRAQIKFIDIEQDTLNMDVDLIEPALTKFTKVIVPVHYGGVACQMDTILEIADKFNILVVEDAAQAFKATYKGRYLGTIGHLAAYSFHETKNIISGEGGALVINDERFFRRAEVIREKGTNRKAFFRGEVDKYSWVDIGSSYLPSELVAAFLYGQLEHVEMVTARRRAIFDYYHQNLSNLEAEGFVRLPRCPPECRHPAHLFYLLVLTSKHDRDRLINHLKSKGVQAVFHYVPLHTSPMGKSLGYRVGDLPRTEELSARLVRLPLYAGLTQEQQNRVIESVYEYFLQSP